MARSGRLLKRLVSARVGCVVLVALIVNVWASAWEVSTGVTSSLGHLIRTTLPLGGLRFDERPDERPFGTGDYHELIGFGRGHVLPGKMPAQGHYLGYAFAAVNDGARGHEVLSTQDVIERYGLDAAIRFYRDYAVPRRLRNPVELEPGVVVSFLIYVNLYFGERGILAPTEQWSTLSLVIVPIDQSVRVAPGQPMPEGGTLEQRYASMIESLEKRLRRLSPDGYVPDTDWASNFRGANPSVGGVDPFSVSLGSNGFASVDAGGMARPLVGGWVRTVAGVVCVLWLPLCVPSMVQSVRTRWRRMRLGPDACIACGYDRSETPPDAPCPECGDQPLAPD